MGPIRCPKKDSIMSEDLEAIRVMGFWYWAWCRTGCYRRFMRWAHRYNWHHCTVFLRHPQDGLHLHWCQWCGLRSSVPLPPKGVEETSREYPGSPGTCNHAAHAAYGYSACPVCTVPQRGPDHG